MFSPLPIMSLEGRPQSTPRLLSSCTDSVKDRNGVHRIKTFPLVTPFPVTPQKDLPTWDLRLPWAFSRLSMLRARTLPSRLSHDCIILENLPRGQLSDRKKRVRPQHIGMTCVDNFRALEPSIGCDRPSSSSTSRATFSVVPRLCGSSR